MHYDIICVGAGAANLFFLLRLIDLNKDQKYKILLIEQGKEPTLNAAVGKTFGGLGLTSDCKVVLSSSTGGDIENFISQEKIKKLEEEFLELIRKYFYIDEKGQFKYTENLPIIYPKQINLDTKFEIVSNKVLHLGTEFGQSFVINLFKMFKANPNITIKLNSKVTDIKRNKNKLFTIEINNNEYLEGNIIIYAPGKLGTPLTKKLIKNLGIDSYSKPPQIGVRVEVPYEVTKKLTDIFYDFKLKLKSLDGETRSFCVSPKGKVIKEIFFNCITYNGGSYKNKQTDKTNFGILFSPFQYEESDGFYYQLKIAEEANKKLKYLNPVSFKEWKNNQDIKEIFKQFNVYNNITAWMEEFENICPTFLEKVFIYIPEIKYSTENIFLNDKLVTNISNLYMIGDCSYARGLYQSFLGGILIADNLL